MKVKTKKKKLKQKFENVENNNDQEPPGLNALKKDFLKTLDQNEESLTEKNKNSEYKNCIKKLYFFASLKIKKKYDCTPSKYDRIILEYLLDNIDCHLVSLFKERMLTDYVEEFLRRKYNISEIRERIPKFSIYYKNYLNFFCKPTYNCFKFNKIIQNYGEKKAEIYYKQNYQGGVTNDEENNGMEESSSDESSNKENEYEFNDDGKIFNNMVKEKLDNVTVMTTISNTGNNTINLNINNEKIEVFSENKAEISNDTTIGEIIKNIKNEMKKIKNKKKNDNKKKIKYYYINIMNHSLKSRENYNDNKYHNNLSIENRKKINSKDISKKLLLTKTNKDKNIRNKIKFSNDKIISQKIKSQIFKYNIESYKINKNRIHKISHEKIQKILKNRFSKDTYNNLYHSNYPYSNFSKDSKTNIRNISSNIKSTENRYKRTNISGLSEKKFKYRSRNNLGYLYKNGVGGMNTTTGKSPNVNFKTTHINKSSLTNLVKSGNKAFKTMNLIKTSAHQRTNSQIVQNKKFIKNKNKISYLNNNKVKIPDKKNSALKLLVTDTENQTHIKPIIKIKKNEKLINKNISPNNHAKIINNKNKSINKIENNINHKITVTTNNYFNNLNSRNSKANHLNMKKSFEESNESLTLNNPNYSNMINNLNPQQLLYNNENCQTYRKNLNYNYNYQPNNNTNLMQIALSLLIDNNSPTRKDIINNNINSNSNTSLNNNTNFLMKNNFTKPKDNKNSYFNINSPTHYNININNQINININGKINGKINSVRGTKSNKKKSQKKIIVNISQRERKKIIPTKKPIQNINLIKTKATNTNSKSNNKIKIKTRNYDDYLKSGLTQNTNINNNSRNEKIIKGYHTKSVSNLEELIKHNNKLIELYKSMSKSKEKK